MVKIEPEKIAANLQDLWEDIEYIKSMGLGRSSKKFQDITKLVSDAREIMIMENFLPENAAKIQKIIFSCRAELSAWHY